jgi:hypothetical protein
MGPHGAAWGMGRMGINPQGPRPGGLRSVFLVLQIFRPHPGQPGLVPAGWGWGRGALALGGCHLARFGEKKRPHRWYANNRACIWNPGLICRFKKQKQQFNM